MYQWLLEHTDSLVAAANFTAVIFLVLLGVITLTILSRKTIKRESDLRIILWGVVIEAFAWAIHRAYWGSWHLAREYNLHDWDKWFIENGYLAIGPSFLVLTGLALMLSPLWKTLGSPTGLSSKGSYFIPAGLILGVYILIWSWVEDSSIGKEPNTLKPREFNYEQHRERTGGASQSISKGTPVPPPVRRM